MCVSTWEHYIKLVGNLTKFVQENLSHSPYCKFKMFNRELEAYTGGKRQFISGDSQEPTQTVLQTL